MNLTQYQSLKEALIYPELYDVIQNNTETMAIWDMVTSDAPLLQVNRMYDTPAVTAVNCSTVITASDISGGPVTFNYDSFQTTVPFCWDVKVSANAGGTAESAILAGMLKAAVGKLESLIIDGGTNMMGIEDLVVAGQTFAKAGAAGSIADLSKAIRITHGAGTRAFITNGVTHDVVEGKLQAASLISYSQLADSTFSTLRYRGIPFVTNENLANGEVYLATLGGDGVSVVFNSDSGRKLGGVFDLIHIPQGLSSINEYYRVLFRASQILRNPQSLTKITGFTA